MTNIKIHHLAITILNTIKRKERQLKDFEKRLEIEREKPTTLSFLCASEKWYEDEIRKAGQMIAKLEMRYLETLKKLHEKEFHNT
jgi:hypothetical protein